MIITVPEALSTNSLIREMDLPHGAALRAVNQTAGRGQRGNSWEAEPGKNLTFSVILRPQSFPAERQFLISQASAVACARLVTDILRQANLPLEAQVKWPNDIYVGHKKIVGMLIENTLSGQFVSSSVIGIGLNVNQTLFLSDAPNPVSLANLTGSNYDIDHIARRLLDLILGYFDDTMNEKGCRKLDNLYRSMLYRRDGIHRWCEAATRREFFASIEGIDNFGRLILRPQHASQPLIYSFKEIIYL